MSILSIIGLSMISASLGGLLVFWINHRHQRSEYLRGYKNGFQALTKRN